MQQFRFNATKWLALTLSSALLVSSCKKSDNATDNSVAITDEETVAAITDATTSGGLTDQVSMMGVIVVPSKASISCGESKDTTIATSGTRTNVSYNYSLALSRTIKCTNYIPSTLTLTYIGANSYSSTKMSSSDSANGSLIVTQLQPTYSSYIFNGSYERKGTQQSNVNLQRAITSDIQFTITSLTVDKTTNTILSGVASVSFVGSTSGGSSSTRGATLTFNGNGQATLVLDNGNSYSITF
ncbi:hypothetical protein [Rhizosphaericola mali]|uniref:Lipoprotein n=1 Tax=Rhizosphaericola mali TaxID=2545455 RepID=A0A5P2FX50_9BACT|nr:hypothetical protein [Rhizosphaericola mali]QES88096.1 hypothetical protein E0W69_005255 [Rhizosphaericola mali]